MEQVIDVVRRQKKVIITLMRHRLSLTRSLYRARPLEIGDEVDWDELEKWVMERQYKYALDRAVAMLAARNHSTDEIRQKLTKAGYLPATADKVIARLNDANLLDDEAFAAHWAETRARKKLGQGRIAMELRQKGIDREEAAAALVLVEEDNWLEGAKSLVRQGLRKAKAGEDPRKVRMRIFAMLARRGYTMDVTREAWELVHQEMDESGDMT